MINFQASNGQLIALYVWFLMSSQNGTNGENEVERC